MAQYPLRVEDGLWRKVKSKAALQGLSIKQILHELLEKWIKESK